MVRIAVIYFLAPRIPRGQRGTNSPVVGGRGSHESKVGTSGQLPAGGNERERERVRRIGKGQDWEERREKAFDAVQRG